MCADGGRLSFPLPPIVVELVAAAAGAAIGAFLRTTVGMTLTGAAAAAACFWYAAQGGAWRGVAAAVLALVLCGVLGLILAAKRAAGRGVRELVRRHRVGARMVEALFDALVARLPAASALDRLPLAQVEAALSEATRDRVDGEGFLRRRIRASLLESVRVVTLARFRDAGDGINLPVVRADLAARADVLIDEHIARAIRRASILLVVLAVVLSCAGALSIREI